jgi:hypothetical protein
MYLPQKKVKPITYVIPFIKMELLYMCRPYITLWIIMWFGLWCLTTIFQLYRGGGNRAHGENH